jgi:hypothetical protein
VCVFPASEPASGSVSGVDPGQLLDHQCVRQGVAPRAAVFGGERDAHQIELGEPLDYLVRERLRSIELLRNWGDLALGELPHCALEESVVI